MRRTAIKPKRIHELTQDYLLKKKIVVYRPYGGRPRDYDDSLILTIACIQNLHQFSFREALEFCEDIFPDLPSLSTYHYRLSKISPKIAQGLIVYLGKKIKSNKSLSRGISFFTTDGTGFSFHDIYPMRLHRGIEIRKIRSHVKAAVLAGVFGKKRRYIISANTGPPYTGDTTLAYPLINDLEPAHGYLLGDKGFDSHQMMALGLSKGLKPAIAIKQGRLHQNINDPLRLRSKRNADNPRIYKKRTLVEGLFGNIKQKLSSHVRIFKLDIARTFVLLRFALFNMAVLASLEKTDIIWRWFSNSLFND